MHSLGIRQMCGATLWTVNMTQTAASIGRAVKGHGMHWKCSGGLRTLEIPVERSGMSRARCIAVDKPLDMLEVCIELEKHPRARSTRRNVKLNAAQENVVDYRWIG